MMETLIHQGRRVLHLIAQHTLDLALTLRQVCFPLWLCSNTGSDGEKYHARGTRRKAQKKQLAEALPLPSGRYVNGFFCYANGAVLRYMFSVIHNSLSDIK